MKFDTFIEIVKKESPEMLESDGGYFLSSSDTAKVSADALTIIKAANNAIYALVELEKRGAVKYPSRTGELFNSVQYELTYAAIMEESKK